MKDQKKKIIVKTMVLDEEDLKNMDNKLVIDISELMKEAGIAFDGKMKTEVTGKNIKISFEID